MPRQDRQGVRTPEDVVRRYGLGKRKEGVENDLKEDTEHPGCYYRVVNGVKEWLNPPLFGGAEYRTTERCMGYPIYTKLVAFGSLPNAQSVSVPHGIEGVGLVLDLYGYTSYGRSLWQGGLTSMWADQTSIHITTTANLSEQTANIILKYTKPNK